MEKLITVALLRDLESQCSKDEISYSRMVEIINEKAQQESKQLAIDILTQIESEVCDLDWGTMDNDVDGQDVLQIILKHIDKLNKEREGK